ncbi:hypothetical protein [Novosphingobium cyanobacteriorum]|uniref:Class I SAM-dependent methyltransferase n=1 Tax=Novosphingobium cyanobacteriorum TaxID=3024215 RepID=A0ABT6CE26_9SPHN|nr:hypothetical protein [Novosphingobium cyanobacteriorum]MDF8332082.1 hypothetical protein [Novosphingobium cyanobacteriorum]
MIRYRVEPKPLPKVKAEHLPGVFGEFLDVVDSSIARFEASRNRFDQEKARFYRYLRERVDPVRFGEMQEAQLADAKLRPNSDIVKYIDPTLWFESKLKSARQLNLADRATTEILDIGTGPAHFPVVAEFYGHTVIGSDVPYRTTGQLERGHLYDALAEIYKVRRIPLKVEQFVPLPAFEKRFGLVTAFLAAFNMDADRKPWTIEAWNFFLNDLRDNVLTQNGEVYMSLADDKLTPEVWTYLSERADFATHVSKNIHITDFSRFG